MKEFFENIDYYVNQYDYENVIYGLGKDIKERGYLLKKEFLDICLWKSRRRKDLYEKNSDEEIENASKNCFKLETELEKIRSLISLRGVGIPTASAILSVIDPEKYPIIDKRCIQSLNHLGLIDWENISEQKWIEYLYIIRGIAGKKGKTARDIEKGLFAYNRIKLDEDLTNLYD